MFLLLCHASQVNRLWLSVEEMLRVRSHSFFSRGIRYECFGGFVFTSSLEFCHENRCLIDERLGNYAVGYNCVCLEWKRKYENSTLIVTKLNFCEWYREIVENLSRFVFYEVEKCDFGIENNWNFVKSFS